MKINFWFHNDEKFVFDNISIKSITICIIRWSYVLLDLFLWFTLKIQLCSIVENLWCESSKTKRTRILIRFYGTIETTNWFLEEKPTSTQLLNCIEPFLYAIRKEKNCTMLRYCGSNIEIVVHIINLPFASFLHVSTPKDKTLPE